MSLRDLRALCDRDWVQDAACRDADPAIFFGQKGSHHDTAAAKAICARCPVIEECLAWALDNDEKWGIWGMTTERERRRMRRGAA